MWWYRLELEESERFDGELIDADTGARDGHEDSEPSKLGTDSEQKTKSSQLVLALVSLGSRIYLNSLKLRRVVASTCSIPLSHNVLEAHRELPQGVVAIGR